jgi:hypothetical protein
MNRIVIIVLLVILLWITGCGVEHAPEANTLGKALLCYNWAVLAKNQIRSKKTINLQAMQSFSAWCFATNCLEMVNAILGEDETKGLRKTYKNLMDNCGGCFDVANVRNFRVYFDLTDKMCKANEVLAKRLKPPAIPQTN